MNNVVLSHFQTLGVYGGVLNMNGPIYCDWELNGDDEDHENYEATRCLQHDQNPKRNPIS